MSAGKMLRFGVVAVAAVIALFAATVPAAAQEGYVGLSWLSSSGDFSSDFDDNSDGWKLWGGYNFNPYFGIELSYYDLGDFEDTEGTTQFTADVSVYDAAVRGILPLGDRFELSGKLGFSSVDAEATVRDPGDSVSVGASDWELIYGVGIAWKIGKSFGLRAEWEAWDVEGDLSAYSIGAYWRFGQR